MVKDIISSYKEKYGKIKLDLASGDRKQGEDFIGVDISDIIGVDIVQDLNQYPWPFEDSSIDEIHCAHYMEHIPHDIQNGNKVDGLFQFINEVYRIMKPGAKMNIVCPYYTSVRAFGDPTHCRSICDWTFYYFNKAWRDTNKLSHYGVIANFDSIISYHISEDMSLRSEQVRNKAFIENWNAVEDIMVEMTKIE